jgi:hypothetical protein
LLIPCRLIDPDVAKIAQISGSYRLARLTCINWAARHCDNSDPTAAAASKITWARVRSTLMRKAR